MKKLLLLCFILLFWVGARPTPTYAHKPSDSYLTLFKKDGIVHGQWDIALRDLDYAIGLDNDNDGNITWAELKSHHSDIENYALEKLRFETSGKFCTNMLDNQLVDYHTDGAYTVLNFEIDCPGKEKAPKVFNLTYELFFDLDPQHHGLLKIKHKEKTQTAIFKTDKTTEHFNLDLLNPFNQFTQFLKEGIWHIFIGYDHILFLIALLLPSVLVRKVKKWFRVEGFKVAFWDVFKIVTGFTIAHSITLSLAALNVIELPSRFVESTIALSIIIAALNNIFPVFKGGRFVIAFLFGLIHGFGFANVLMDLGLPKDTLLIALVSFNIGVEIGQLVIVSLLLPITFQLSKTWIYEKAILIFGSILISAIALIWFIERAFNF